MSENRILVRCGNAKMRVVESDLKYWADRGYIVVNKVETKVESEDKTEVTDTPRRRGRKPAVKDGEE